MWYDLLYYIALPCAAISASFGAWYIYDPNNVQRKALKLSWEASKIYLECSDWFSRYIYSVSDTKKDTINNSTNVVNISSDSTNINDLDSREENDDNMSDDDSNPEYKGVLYYENTKQICYSSDLDEEVIKKIISKIKPNIMFIQTKIKDTMYYKRTTDPTIKNSTYLTMTNKPFIQIELIRQGEEVLDIHSHLGSFYVNGNKILDRSFLEWYLDYFYTLKDLKEYELRVFDKDVNMFTIKSDQAVYLENDTYRVASSDETYEGATEE